MGSEVGKRLRTGTESYGDGMSRGTEAGEPQVHVCACMWVSRKRKEDASVPVASHPPHTNLQGQAPEPHITNEGR